MKFLLLFMFVAAALAFQDSMSSQDRLVRSLARVFQIDQTDSLECIRKSEVTIEDLMYLEDGLEMSDTEITDMKSLKRAACVLVCCAQRIGVMVGGELQLEPLFKFFEKTGIPEDVVNPLRSEVRICKEQVTDTSDECMAGYKVVKCVYQRSRMIAQHK